VEAERTRLEQNTRADERVRQVSGRADQGEQVARIRLSESGERVCVASLYPFTVYPFTVQQSIEQCLLLYNRVKFWILC
jgi:hypothetical protein